MDLCASEELIRRGEEPTEVDSPPPEEGLFEIFSESSQFCMIIATLFFMNYIKIQVLHLQSFYKTITIFMKIHPGIISIFFYA